MTPAAGWKSDVSPATVIATLIVLILGVPAALIVALLALGTAIGLVVW
jgi:hypothetical protein